MALTVKEAMTFAANLKLGYTVSSEYKSQQVGKHQVVQIWIILKKLDRFYKFRDLAFIKI
jgi:hypothetical protein